LAEGTEGEFILVFKVKKLKKKLKKVSLINVLMLFIAILAVYYGYRSYQISRDEFESSVRVTFNFELLEVPYTGPRGHDLGTAVGFVLSPVNSEMTVIQVEAFFDRPLYGYLSQGMRNYISRPPDLRYDLSSKIIEINSITFPQFEPWEIRPPIDFSGWYTDQCHGYFPMILETEYVLFGVIRKSVDMYRVHYSFFHYASNDIHGRKGIEISRVEFREHLSSNETGSFGKIDETLIDPRCDFRKVEALPEGMFQGYEPFPHYSLRIREQSL